MILQTSTSDQLRNRLTPAENDKIQDDYATFDFGTLLSETALEAKNFESLEWKGKYKEKYDEHLDFKSDAKVADMEKDKKVFQFAVKIFKAEEPKHHVYNADNPAEPTLKKQELLNAILAHVKILRPKRDENGDHVKRKDGEKEFIKESINENPHKKPGVKRTIKDWKDFQSRCKNAIEVIDKQIEAKKQGQKSQASRGFHVAGVALLLVVVIAVFRREVSARGASRLKDADASDLEFSSM